MIFVFFESASNTAFSLITLSNVQDYICTTDAGYFHLSGHRLAMVASKQTCITRGLTAVIWTTLDQRVAFPMRVHWRINLQ